MLRLLSYVFIIMLVAAWALPADAREAMSSAYFDFGVFAYEDQDYKDAEMNFLKALESGPDHPSCNYFLGKTYLKMKRFEDAIKYFDRARKLDPELPGLKYDTALLHFAMSDFKTAAQIFEEVFAEEPANALAAYQAGISYYKLDRYRQALDFFLTASEKSPSIKANGFYYAGICFHKMGKIEQAIEKFAYVRNTAVSALLKNNAAKWIEAIERRQAALKPYNLYLKLGYQFDDNVLLEPVDQDLATDEQDYATVLLFSGSYNMVNRSDLKVGAGYTHYQTWYDSLTQFDLTGSIGNLYVKYHTGSITSGVAYSPIYYWLDDDSYLFRHQLKPEVVWAASKNLTFRFAYSYYRNNYFQDNGRDGHTHEISTDVYYSMMDRKAFLFAGVLYEDNRATDLDQYYEQWKTTLGASFQLPWELSLNITGKYYSKQYDNVDATIGVTRNDDKYLTTVSLERPIFREWLHIVAEYNFTKNDSNISSFEYERNVLTLSLSATY